VVELIRERPDALLCNRETCRPCSASRKYIVDTSKSREELSGKP
jgi:hypothetical protein